MEYARLILSHVCEGDGDDERAILSALASCVLTGLRPLDLARADVRPLDRDWQLLVALCGVSLDDVVRAARPVQRRRDRGDED